MSALSDALSSHGGFEFFNEATLGYFLPYIRCVTRLRKAPSVSAAAGFCYVFKVFFSHQLDIECGFEDHQKAAWARRDLILHMVEFWGAEIIFLDGFSNDVTVEIAIVEVTGVSEKDGRAGFSVSLSDVPTPLRLIFRNIEAAREYHQCLTARLERRRRLAGLQRHGSAIANV